MPPTTINQVECVYMYVSHKQILSVNLKKQTPKKMHGKWNNDNKNKKENGKNRFNKTNIKNCSAQNRSNQGVKRLGKNVRYVL